MDVIGRAFIGSQEKQAQVFTGVQKYVRIEPRYVTALPLCLLSTAHWLKNMFFTRVLACQRLNKVLFTLSVRCDKGDGISFSLLFDVN